MGAQYEEKSVEAEIAECCQAIYSTSEIDIAMRQWTRLRELIAQRHQAEELAFMREAAGIAATQADERRP